MLSRVGRQPGAWEFPAPDALVAGGEIRLRGWIEPDPGGRPRVVVHKDGMPVAEAHGLGGPEMQTAGPLRWEVVMSTVAEEAGSTLEVVAWRKGIRTSLGARRLRRVRAGESVSVRSSGSLDLPRPDTTVRAGSALTVAGWVHFAGRPAESVELYMGGSRPIPLRNNLPRPDLLASVSGGSDDDPRVLASGFSDLAPVPQAWVGREMTVCVRARSVEGRTWTSPAVRVRVTGEAADVGRLDQESPLAAVPAPVRREGRAQTAGVRVCVFTHSLQLGGGELYLQELVVRLARDHHCEILVVAPEDGPLRDELRRAGVGVHITRLYAFDPARYFGGMAELRAILRSWQADAVIVNTLGIFPGVDAALQEGLPVFWAIHESFPLEVFSYLVWGPIGLHPVVRDRWIRCLGEAVTIFESEVTRDLFRRQVPGLTGSVIRYGIDLSVIARYRESHSRDSEREQLGISRDEFVLLCMGVIQERKSQMALVLAFAAVARANPRARLVLVGDHPSTYAESVRQLIDRLGMTERVRVEPIQPDTYRWYLIADVLVSASDTESLPRSVMEAMAFGRPVLAADVFGLSEVVHDGENGWLCRPRSTASLVTGLRRVLETDPDTVRHMAATCEADARAFDGAGYAAAYDALIRNGSIGPSPTPPGPDNTGGEP